MRLRPEDLAPSHILLVTKTSSSKLWYSCIFLAQTKFEIQFLKYKVIKAKHVLFMFHHASICLTRPLHNISNSQWSHSNHRGQEKSHKFPDKTMIFSCMYVCVCVSVWHYHLSILLAIDTFNGNQLENHNKNCSWVIGITVQYLGNKK